MRIKDKEFDLFIHEDAIGKRVKALAGEISTTYAGLDPVFVPILNGAFLFASDLIKEVSIPCELSFVKTSSYDGTTSTGEIKKLSGLNMDLRSRHVVLIDDIIDTGLTMHSIFHEIMGMKPASVEIASLLLKPEAVQKQLEVKYVGFTIPNDFVVGYGLDYDGFGRNLKDIYRIKS